MRSTKIIEFRYLQESESKDSRTDENENRQGYFVNKSKHDMAENEIRHTKFRIATVPLLE